MRHALVIDAAKTTHAEAQPCLERLGFCVLHSPNGEEALRMASETPIDIVIADMRASTRDGVEVIRTFRLRFPQCGIIALTGSALTHAAEFESVVNRLGIEGLLPKPLDTRALSRAVQGLLFEKARLSPSRLGKPKALEPRSAASPIRPSFMLPSHSNRLQVPTSPLGGTAA